MESVKAKGDSRGVTESPLMLFIFAAVVEQVDTADLKSAGESLEGSSPFSGTIGLRDEGFM